MINSKLPNTQIDMSIYNDILENWGKYSRRDGLKKLGYSDQSVFYLQAQNNSVEPNEVEAGIAEKALISMLKYDDFSVNWLKHKYYLCLTDMEMSKEFGCSLAKSKSNKKVALALFGMCYEDQKVH